MKQNNFKNYLVTCIISTSPFFSMGGKLGCMSDHTSEAALNVRSDRPNIIIILADDLGYGDIGGYYGGKAQTPNLTRLAQEGMLFTDFHSNGVMCSPTRASLITGRYQQRLGIERALSTDWDDKGIGDEKNSQEITMADYLRKAGYTTGFFGKWHLGKHPSANPIFHGFDEFWGLTCGCGDYFTKIDRNGYEDWWHNDELKFQEGYTTNVITSNALNFIKSQKDKHFFLYIAHLGVHFPWQTSEDENLETREKGKDYTSNYPGSGSKLGPHSPEQIPFVHKRMIEELDREIGRVMNALKEEGLDKNTLLFFTSDNGGYLNYNDDIWPEVGSNGILKGQKAQVYEGGHRVPAIGWWPGRIPALSVSHETVMTFDLLPTFLDILGIEIPGQTSENSIDGVSIMPLLLENKKIEPRLLFWRMTNQKAVRYGEWKLVVPDLDKQPELYNLKNDIGETNNLASENPEMVLRLLSEFQLWENKVTKGGFQ